MTLLIEGGTVVRHLSPAELERVDVLVDAGRIAAVGRDLLGDERLDAGGCLLIPGNVNTHTHAYAALARGMPFTLAAPRTFIEILQRLWWRLDCALDHETIAASALSAARDALLCGTTTLIDHHSSPNAIDGSLDVIADAFARVGIRSVLCYEVSDRDGEQSTAAALAENDRFARRCAADPAAPVRAMIGGHAAFTMGARTMAEAVGLARLHRVGLHVHAAEDAIDRSAVLRLHNEGALDERSLLAHTVHIDLAEVEQIQAANSFVVHNPRSNMNNGVGRAPVNLLGPRVALGTDGIDGDMFEETRTAYFRRREGRIDVTPDWAAARLAAGASVAARSFDERALGSISVGAPADLVVLDYDAPTPIDPDNLAGHLVFGLRAAHTRDVLVAGEVVVRDRQLTRVDEAQLLRGARDSSRALWRALEDMPVHPLRVPEADRAVAGVR